MKVFLSGSCRLLTTINNGFGKVEPIHTMFYHFVGINFFGKLHNIKQHIQFIKFIKNEITIPNYILPKFLTSYNKVVYDYACEDFLLLPIKKNNINKLFDDCEWYIFEICSIKIYKNNGYEVQHELTSDYECVIQTEEELLEDLNTIKSLIPQNKKILFQVHFRPQIIYDDNTKTIEKREIIYNTVNKFCKNNKNTYIHDPSIIIKNNHNFFDGDSHFTEPGYNENFNYIYNKILCK